MSRNLGQVDCRYCPSHVILIESPRSITKAEAGAYYGDYANMLVANAECPACLAQYLAWCSPPQGQQKTQPSEDGSHYDLSFRSSFNDEPGERDLPRYEVVSQLVRVGPWTSKSYLNLGPVPK